MFSGEELLSPIFYFGLCNDTVDVVQDAYRANVYVIPEEVTAQPSPQCSFVVTTTEYKSISEYATSLAEKSCAQTFFILLPSSSLTLHTQH